MAIVCVILCPVFPASRVQHISDMHSQFALRPHHVQRYGRHPVCHAEIRRWKSNQGQIYNLRICYAGQP